jgi:hypothetical protein
VVEELAAQLQQPPSVEELYQAAMDITNSTTPGMVEFSCGHIKEWPPELQEHCYHLLRDIWSQDPILQK